MGYKLAEQNGESVAVPRLVFSHLGRADGDTVRVALKKKEIVFERKNS